MIETGNLCNILPRGIDGSDVVFAQLKRKPFHKFPVTSEPVRSKKLNYLLQFFTEKNPFVC